MNGQNEWDVSYATIQWVEQGLKGHVAVESFERRDDIVFNIERTGGRDPVKVVLIARYVIGQADVMKVAADFPGVQMVVANGNWCGYTQEAKEYGREQGIGVFEMGEFFGALHRGDYVNYAKKNHGGEKTYSYKNA